MRSAWRAAVLVVACQGRVRSTGTDAAAATQPAASGTAIASLAGQWHGAAKVAGRGEVSAVLTISPSGEISYVLVTASSVHSGVARLERWDGANLEVRAEGHSVTLSAARDGQVLEIEAPVVGRLRMVRDPQGR